MNTWIEEVFFTDNALQNLPDILLERAYGQKYAIVTDSEVASLFGSDFSLFLDRAGIKSELFVFPAGETAKTLATLEILAEKLVLAGFGRWDAIIALGGGVVGDLAGFLASIYMRGIPCLQIPTTLLAMVDSAFGGKNGVDLQVGKNLLGTINPAKAVVIDFNFLQTLPEIQFLSGIAEIIKYGAIADENLFVFLEKNVAKILNRDAFALKRIVEISIKIKTAIVNSDLKEDGVRMHLNYGHTFGHALEKISNFTLPHGFAVAVGMILVNELAVQRGITSLALADRVKSLLRAFGLPVASEYQPTVKDILADKKRCGDLLNFVMLKQIGEACVCPISLHSLE